MAPTGISRRADGLLDRDGGALTARSLRSILVWLMGVAILVPLPGLGGAAAQAPYVSVSGTVHTTDGQPVSGALVIAEAAGTAREFQTRTAFGGTFALPFLPPGEYTVRVERVGYRPVVVESVELDAGGALARDFVLEATGPERGPLLVEGRRHPAVGARTGGDPLLSRTSLLPSDAEPILDGGALAAGVTRRSVEGLPLSWLTARLGGSAIGSSGARQGGAGALALPMALVQGVDVRSLPDVEWQTAMGVGMNILHREWTAPALTASVAERSVLYGEHSPGGTGIFAGGGLEAGDREAVRLSAGGAWELGVADGIPSDVVRARRADARATAADAHRIDLRAWDPEAHRVGATARLEARTGSRSLLRLDGILAWQLRDGMAPAIPSAHGAAPTSGGSVEAAWVIQPGRASIARSETRAGVTWSGWDDEHDVALPLTLLTDGIVSLGEASRARSERTVTLGQSATFDWGAHTLKGGVEADLLLGRYRIDPRETPAFTFGSASAMAGARGFATMLYGQEDRIPVSLPRYVGFVQDSWQVSPRMRLLAGTRFLVDYLPVAEIELNRSWYFAKGEANNAIDRFHIDVEPRVAIDAWVDEGRTTRAFGAAAVHVARLDPRAMAEVIGNAGEQTVRRSYGQLGGWPTIPIQGRQGRALSIPSSSLRPPRTFRAEGGIEHRTDPRTTFRLSATFRQTDHLLTRTDANVRSRVWGQDSHGRNVRAPLVAESGVIAAEPGTWFSLADFDRVWRLESSAFSRYLGLTIEASHRTPEALSISGQYTLSRARDDWSSPAFAEYVHATPVALRYSEEAGPRVEGVSDLDAPHEVVGHVSLPLKLTGAPVLALTYTFRSGLPFTPSMGHAIDADGDGLFNDVAFIDPTVAGLDALLDDWGCLRDQADSFAARNSCRSPHVHRLDAALGIGIFRRGATEGRIRLEALGIVGTAAGVVDAAVYRTTGGQPVVSGSTVALPLEANADFGSVLLDYGSARSVRIGAEISF